MAKPKDLSGQRFGRLVAQKIVGKNSNGSMLWECVCDCGKICVVSSRELRRGDTRSCGCLKLERDILQAEDLTGQKFGRLTVIRRTENRGKAVAWECQCECGKTCVVVTDKLKSGWTRSCGCLQKERTSKAAKTRPTLWKNTNIALIRSQKIPQTNTSGVKGVTKRKNGYYVAEIGVQKKHITLGWFKDLDRAAAVRKQAEEDLHKPLIEKFEKTQKENTEKREDERSN